MTLPLDEIICGNNVDVLSSFPDECIDLTVTSPPYDKLRNYKGYTLDFEGVARESWRITKRGGVLVWVVGDATNKGTETGTSFKQALYFMSVGFNLHDTMIYRKIEPPPQEQHPRYKPAFEYMFVFCKGYPPRVFNPITRQNKLSGKTITSPGQRNANGTMRHENGKIFTIKERSVIDNVWEYVPARNPDHPAPFPEQLAEDHILSWSNPDDIVLDPFVGSGTTAKMAIRHNRRYIGIDISAEYCEIARRRVSDVQTCMSFAV